MAIYVLAAAVLGAGYSVSVALTESGSLVDSAVRESSSFALKMEDCETAVDARISQNTVGNYVCDLQPYANDTDGKFEFDEGDFVIE